MRAAIQFHRAPAQVPGNVHCLAYPHLIARKPCEHRSLRAQRSRGAIARGRIDRTARDLPEHVAAALHGRERILNAIRR